MNWREWKKNTKNCKEDCPTPKSHYLIDGLYSVILIDDYGYLQPIYWKKEKALWLLLRSEWVYEVSYPPPVMYFMNMDANTEMDTFFQPIPSWLHSQAESYGLRIFKENQLQSNSLTKSVDNEHVIFVIHGIGHHESEEGVVKNSYSIRKGFIKYLKKFHPTFKIPYIIPVAWRHNLTLNDETLRVTPLTKNDFIKSVGFVLNDVFYYLSKHKKEILDNLINKLNDSYGLFKSRNPNFSGNFSILAHSLGSVLTFDLIDNPLPFKIDNIFLIGSPLGRFLANDGKTAEKLKQNPWIKNGKLFNILHSDDPVAHRLEVLFNVNYTYANPANLYFHKNFRSSFDKSIKIDEIEEQEVESFHRYINDDRAMALSHDSFLTVDYLAHGFKFDTQHFNVSDISEMFKGKLEFLRGIFINKKIRNDTQIVHYIPPEKRIKHRYDFDLYKTEFAEDDESDNIFLLETKFIQWMREFGYSHISYWKRSEVIALMTNVIFNYVPEKRYESTISPYENETYIRSHKAAIRTHGTAWCIWKSFNQLLCWVSIIILIRYLDPEITSKLLDDFATRNYTVPVMFLLTLITIFFDMLSIILNLKPDIVTYITSCFTLMIFSLWIIFSKSSPIGNIGRQQISQEIPMVNFTISEGEATTEVRSLIPPPVAQTTKTIWAYLPSVGTFFLTLIYFYLIIRKADTILGVVYCAIAVGLILLCYSFIFWFDHPFAKRKFFTVPFNAPTRKILIIEVFRLIWKLLAIEGILFILLCPLNIVSDLGIRSFALVFLIFYILRQQAKKMLINEKHFWYFWKQETDKCLEKEIQKTMRASKLPIQEIYFANTAREVLFESYWKTIVKKLFVFIRHILQLCFCLAICYLLLFFLPSPDTLAEVGWNVRDFINKIFPNWNFSKWWIHGIYIAIFIPSALNFLITEKRYNLYALYRIIYNCVLVLSALWLINNKIKEASEKIRDYDLGCVHSDIKGFCREYIMYNNVSNEHVGLRTDDDEPPSLW